MAWDEWEQLKQEAAGRHDARMQLNQVDPGLAGSSVTGGVKSTKKAWNAAGEGVGSLREGIGKALIRLGDGQESLGAGEGCLTAEAQKEVHASWVRYVKAVNGRCDGIKQVFEKVGRDLLMTDESVRFALQAIDTEYADTAPLGGKNSGR